MASIAGNSPCFLCLRLVLPEAAGEQRNRHFLEKLQSGGPSWQYQFHNNQEPESFISFRAGGRLTLGEGGRGLRLLVFAHTGNKESFAIPRTLSSVHTHQGVLSSLQREGGKFSVSFSFHSFPLHRMFFCVEVWGSGERVPGCSSQGAVSGCRLCWHSLTPRMGTMPQCTTLGGAVDFLGRVSLV